MQSAEESSRALQLRAEQLKVAEEDSQDEPKALLFRGMKQIKGDGVPKNQTEGLQLISRAAIKGDASAQEYLGDCYMSGKQGLPRNYDEAFSWYQKAAEQGGMEAQNKLAQMYDFQASAGLERDFVLWKRKTMIPEYRKNRDLAIKWYQAAADQGHKQAQTRLYGLRDGSSIYIPISGMDAPEAKGRTVMQMTSGDDTELFVDINSVPQSSCTCIIL